VDARKDRSNLARQKGCAALMLETLAERFQISKNRIFFNIYHQQSILEDLDQNKA